MLSNSLEKIKFTIPSCREIIYVRQFQNPSFYQAIGILLLKLIARFVRNKSISSNLCASLQELKNETINYRPLYEEYVTYYFKLIDFTSKNDNEVAALQAINALIPIGDFLQWVSAAIKAILITINKDKDYIISGLENNENFYENRITLFTSLTSKLKIAIKLYYFDKEPDQFYPNKIGAYPFMHILYNEVNSNGLNFNTFIEIYTDELHKLETSNLISIIQLQTDPFSYSNGNFVRVIKDSDVTISALLLDKILTEIIKINNELPLNILQRIQGLAEKCEDVAKLPSLDRILRKKSTENLETSIKCGVCSEFKMMKEFPSSKCRSCNVCIECRLDSLNQCKLCYKNFNRDEKEYFKNFKN
ncbi:hypothetical protein SteCoe_30125 [Stentor coeruleus]|uniref:Uncharacterized protein n=1 Tax=Stentor coeruleus TaxID=5963 RepID=A0A1R2B4D3_9CILI|nr:hypothetical protein SteCoe_30125 [Stentor coeruleus]